MKQNWNTLSWWRYTSIWHRILRRKTFYFKPVEGEPFAYWIDKKGNLHPAQFVEFGK